MALPVSDGVTYAFGDYELDTRRHELRRSGQPQHVEPQVFDVLAQLLAHRDRVVPKAELLDAVWATATWRRRRSAAASRPPARPSVTTARRSA
jgi:DNA-binding winged helix-turn-helix (wHTH) protein